MKTIFSLSRKTPLPRLALSTPYIPKRTYIYSAYSKGMLPTDHPVKGSNNHSLAQRNLKVMTKTLKMSS